MLKKKAGTIMALALLLAPLLITQPVMAQTSNDAKNAVCQGLGSVTGDNGCVADVDDADVDSTIQTVINILSLVGGVIAVIMIIIGGIRYVTSSGDSGSTASARNTIIYALVGLVIIALAQVIVQFTVGRIDDPDGSNNQSTVDDQMCNELGRC